MSKKLEIYIKGDFFKCNSQPTGFDELPEEFSEAQLLLKESKKNINNVSTLLGHLIEATFYPDKVENSDNIFTSNQPVHSKSINIEGAKFSNKIFIPNITVLAIFECEIHNSITEDFLMNIMADWVNSAEFKWNIDFWGVADLDLGISNPEQFYVGVENIT